MKSIVCVKQVPAISNVEIDKKNNTIKREGIPSILNPYDQFAVEENVRLRDKFGKGKITVITMGPPQAIDVLKKCLALGADNAILLCDEAFAGADTWATAFTLSLAIKKIGKFDVVLCGQQAIDGDTGQVGPELAQHLSIPQVTYVEEIKIKKNNKFFIKKQTEDGFQKLEVSMPILLALLPPTSFNPEYPSFKGVLKAENKKIIIWNAESLGGDQSKFGLQGSLTQVKEIYNPKLRKKGRILTGDTKDITKELARIFLKKRFVNKR